MALDVFINFDGNCREALTFYADVFGVEPERVMRYGDNPDGGMNPADTDRILYANLPLFGSNVMLSDCSSGFPFVTGTNIALTIGLPDAAELTRLYDRLADGGSIYVPLGQQFFNELFAMVTDRFGIGWQLSKTPA
jgi:PhnB protein